MIEDEIVNMETSAFAAMDRDDSYRFFGRFSRADFPYSLSKYDYAGIPENVSRRFSRCLLPKYDYHSGIHEGGSYPVYPDHNPALFLLDCLATLKKSPYLAVPEFIFDTVHKLVVAFNYSENDHSACIKIALAGAFSSGKSSFLNAILEGEFAPIAEKRLTRGRTDFTYGEELLIIDNSNKKTISLKKYQKNIIQATKSREYIFKIPNKKLQGIIITDTPGFDPPQEDKNSAADVEISIQAVKSADAVFFLFVAKDGTIKGNSLKYLLDINNRTSENKELPVRIYLIMNKVDLMTSQELSCISEEIIEKCKSNGICYEDILFYSSKPSKNMREKQADFIIKSNEHVNAVFNQLQTEKQLIIKSRNRVLNKLKIQLFTECCGEIIEWCKEQNKHLKEILQKSYDSDEQLDDFADEIATIIEKYGTMLIYSSSGNSISETQMNELKNELYCQLNAMNFHASQSIVDMLANLVYSCIENIKKDIIINESVSSIAILSVFKSSYPSEGSITDYLIDKLPEYYRSEARKVLLAFHQYNLLNVQEDIASTMQELNKLMQFINQYIKGNTNVS